MHDEKLFDHLSDNMRKTAEARRQLDELSRHLDDLDRESSQLMFSFVEPVYARWRPSGGDTAYYVDLLDGSYFEVVVREVHGSYVRTQAVASGHTAFYSVTLDLPRDEYEQARFILPPDAFETLRDALVLRPSPQGR